MKIRNRAVFLIALLCTITLIGQTETEVTERNEQIRERWNRSLVRDSTYIFNKESNNLLRQATKGVQPGQALCVAMGQGRNALYLARNGWEVTGFDLADEAVAYAVEQAAKEQIELHTEITSIEDFDYGNNKWDLMTWLYGGCLDDDGIVKKIKSALKPGGLLVFEFFHRDAGLEMDRPAFGCEESEIKDRLTKEGGFKILLYEEKEGIADYSLENYKLVYLVASKL